MVNTWLSLGHIPNTFKQAAIRPFIKTYSVAVLWIYGVSLIKKTPKLAGEGSSVNCDGIQHTCDYSELCDYSGRVMLLNCIML